MLSIKNKFLIFKTALLVFGGGRHVEEGIGLQAGFLFFGEECRG
jgi:hypothetical protein